MKKNKLLIKIVNIIVKLRYIFLVLFILLALNSIINNKPYIFNNTNNYENKEFQKIQEIKIMIENINQEDNQNIINNIKKIDYVKNIITDYKEDNSLIILYIDKSSKVKKDIKNIINNYDYYLYIEDYNKTNNNYIPIILCISILILILLVLTTHSYFDILLGLIIFIISIIINIGININDSNILIIIFQLSILMYYYLIHMHHYNKEIDDSKSKLLAMKKTLLKSLPKILYSSLITILVVLPLYFIKLNIGKYLCTIIIKTIIINTITIILLLPCLQLLFNNIILKLRHRSITINIKKIASNIIKVRKIILIVFIIIFIISLFLIPKFKYIYNDKSLKNHNKTDNEISLNKINNTFGYINHANLIIKNSNKDYNKELQLTNKLLKDKKILSITNLGNIKLEDNLYLGSNINYQEFASIFNIDTDTSINIYKMYAETNEETIKLNDIDNYEISITNLINYLKDQSINENINNLINDYNNILNHYQKFLETDNYSKFIIEYKEDIESIDTYKLLDTIKEDVKKIYKDVTIEGTSINSRNIKTIFNTDKFKTSLITTIIILIILLITTKSFKLSILLSLLIESNIIISLSLINLINNNIFYISYVILKILEIIFLINYATNIYINYQQNRKKYNKNNSIIKTLNISLLPIITSSLIIIILNFISSTTLNNNIISHTNNYIGIGLTISLLLTLFLIPNIIYKCDKLKKIK